MRIDGVEGVIQYWAGWRVVVEIESDLLNKEELGQTKKSSPASGIPIIFLIRTWKSYLGLSIVDGIFGDLNLERSGRQIP